MFILVFESSNIQSWASTWPGADLKPDSSLLARAYEHCYCPNQEYMEKERDRDGTEGESTPKSEPNILS